MPASIALGPVVPRPGFLSPLLIRSGHNYVELPGRFSDSGLHAWQPLVAATHARMNAKFNYTVAK